MHAVPIHVLLHTQCLVHTVYTSMALDINCLHTDVDRGRRANSIIDIDQDPLLRNVTQYSYHVLNLLLRNITQYNIIESYSQDR